MKAITQSVVNRPRFPGVSIPMTSLLSATLVEAAEVRASGRSTTIEPTLLGYNLTI